MKHERAQHSENPYKLECDICGRPFRFVSDKHMGGGNPKYYFWKIEIKISFIHESAVKLQVYFNSLERI